MNPITVTRNIFSGINVRFKISSIYDTDCETKVDKNDWGIRVANYTSDESSLVVSEVYDTELIDKLLSVYSVVTTASLEAYNSYISNLRRIVGNLAHEVRKSSSYREIVTLDQYLTELGNKSDFGNVAVGDGVDETEQVVYFLGVPEVMLSLWTKYTFKSPLTMHVKHQDGVQEINLTEEVAPLCTRYESLQSAGCVACPHKQSCISELLGENISPVNIQLEALKKSMKRLKVDLIPHADCAPHRGSEKIDITDISMTNALERNTASKEKRMSIRNNIEFYNSNCSQCSIKDLCGTRKGYGPSSMGVSSFCSGKLDKDVALSVTPDNYEAILKVILTSMFFACAGCMREKEAQQAVDKAREWVESDKAIPGHASYFLSKLKKARTKGLAHQEYYVVPRQLIDLYNIFDFRGTFDGYDNMWHRHSIGKWLVDSTDSITSLLPYNKQKTSNWVAILPRHVHIQSPDYYNIPMHEYVDTLVLAKVQGVKYSYNTTMYSTKKAKIHLLFEFIKHFMCPYNELRYGPFGSAKALVPQGIPGRWTWSWELRKRVCVPDSFSMDLTVNNVKDIVDRLRNGVSTHDYERIYNQLKNNNIIKEILLNG